MVEMEVRRSKQNLKETNESLVDRLETKKDTLITLSSHTLPLPLGNGYENKSIPYERRREEG